ncbi:MAG: endopeptidase La, partial [Rhodoferax sp.]|nr:endopeptidase La [Rhodoferax sp.]
TLNAVRHIEAPERLADTVAGYLDLKASEKQEVLELLDLRQRMDRLLVLLGHRIEVMRISQDIEQHTRVSLDRREREFLLREQMKSIQRELGENGSHGDAELQELRQRLNAASLPEEAARLADKELQRLERMPESSAEQAMVRNHLDWLCELPWAAPAADRIDLAQAREQLDAEHFGMDKVKQRILEFLAVRQLKPDGQGPILCLMGPPGVGKTSLGQSIAKALGRPLVRVSLGGLHDEAEIRGHRRTYIGALPGRILQALRKAGTRGCVMLLDEIDKLGAGAQGDPAAALLEVLDPQQNSSFRDNYLAVACDLSPVLFITTANLPDPIAGALRDRLEVIPLSGYTAEEKLEIAQRHLVQRQRAACGLDTGQLDLPPDTLLTLIRQYTREAGVRNLERQIGALCRQAAVHFASGGHEPVRVRPVDLPSRLGPPPFENEVALRVGLPGVATGLAWTSAGGDILFIEACLTSGTGRLILTGQLGEVMKESAQAALTLVKSRALALGVDASRLERADLHLHVPAGAIPKDGPSAGVALFIAIASLLLGKPVRSDLAMTGEISLRGLVLPVGGIREKVLAARAAGLRRVLLPSRNRKDLQELPDPVRHDLVFVLLDDVDEALRQALAPSQAPAAGDALAFASSALQGNGPAVTLEQPGGAAC